MNENKSRTLQVEVNIAYMFSLALDKLMMDIERRLLLQKEIFRRDKKVLFNKMMDGIYRAYRAAAELNTDIEVSASETSYKDLDVWNDEANELCRLVLLYSDKCGKYPDNANEVFKLLRSMKGEDVITEKDLERFYLKK